MNKNKTIQKQNKVVAALFLLIANKILQIIRINPPLAEAIIVLACAISVTTIYYYDVVFNHKTLTTPYGITTGTIGDLGAYKAPSDLQIWPKYAAFFKDFGSNAWQGVPLSVKSKEAFKSFALPLWNDNIAAGKPLAANFLSNPFHFPKIILYVFSHPVNWDIYLLFRFCLGIVFMYYFLRLLGLQRLPSAFGGIAFAFSGIFVLYQNIQDLDVGFLVPAGFWLVLYIYKKCRDNLGIWEYLGAVLVALSLLLSDIPEPLILLVFSCIIFWLYFVIKLIVEKNSQLVKNFLLVSIKIIGPAILISFPLYLLNLEFTLRAITTHPVEAAQGLSQLWSKEALGLALPFVSSKIFFLPDSPISVGNMNYFGLITSLLVLVGAISVFKKRRGIWLYIFIFTSIVFLKIYGSNFLYLNDIIGNLPGLNRVIFVKYAQPLLSLGAASIATLGVSELCLGRLRYKDVVIALSVLLGATIVLAVIIQQLSTNIYLAQINLGMLLNMLMILVVIALFFISIVAIIYYKDSRHKVVLIAVLLIVACSELWLFVHRDHRPFRYNDFTPAPYTDYLTSQTEPYRILGINRLMIPQISAGFNIDDIRDLDGLYDKEYYSYITNFISPGVTDRFSGATDENNEKGSLDIFKNQFLDLMNVRYVITDYPLDERKNGGQYKLVLSQSAETPLQPNLAILLYENTHALPRAFTIKKVISSADNKQTIDLMKDESFNARESAVVTGISKDEIATLDENCSMQAVTDFTKINSGHVSMEVDSSGRCLLLYSDAFYPGWVSRVDGKTVDIYQSDLMFKGIIVDKGVHTVEFVYSPKLFYYGLILPLLGIVGVAYFVRKRNKNQLLSRTTT